MTGQVSGMPLDGGVKGQLVMRDREGGLVWHGGEAGGMEGNGLHRGHCRVDNDALVTFAAVDRRPGHLFVRDFHVFP